jgi:hypothetical protein
MLPPVRGIAAVDALMLAALARLDDVQHAIVVQREIVGEAPGFVQTEDAPEIFVARQGTMRVALASRWSCEPAVVLLPKVLQECVALVSVADRCQAQRSHESVLQSLMCTLDTSFWLLLKSLAYLCPPGPQLHLACGVWTACSPRSTRAPRAGCPSITWNAESR